MKRTFLSALVAAVWIPASAVAQPSPSSSLPSPSAPAPVVPVVSATTPPAGVDPAAAAPTPAAAVSPELQALISAQVEAQVAAQVEVRVEAQLAKRAETAGWKDGFFLQSADGKHKLRLGAIVQFDARAFFADEDDPHTDQLSFRSLRPELAGTLFDFFDFRLLPDFAGSRVVVQDAYVDLRTSDKLKVRFGKFKVPFGLERLQAETATLFAERGLPTQLAPNRDLGIQIFGELSKGALTYQAGVFNGVADGASGDGDSSDDKEVAARLFVKPFALAGALGKAFKELGLGAAVTYGDKKGTVAASDVAGLRSSGQTTFFAYKTGTTLTDTVVADGAHFRATAQASYFVGPVGGLAEYVRSAQTVVLAGTHERIDADAWQLAAQWVITGEDATWKSVSPARPFDPGKGQWGAFDVVGRFGELRLLDGEVFDQGFADATRAARRAYSAGAGVDWFPNKSLRFVVDVETTWFRLGAKDAAAPTVAADRATETSVLGRVQTVF